MKNVLKSAEPPQLAAYRARFANQPTPRTWDQFRSSRDSNVVSERLFIDQKGLCAYCEIDLTERDRAVEHFIPKHVSTKADNLHLSWPNLLMIRKGGLEAAAVGPGEQPAYRQSVPPNVQPCCGAAKLNQVPDGRLLNPLEIPPFPRLFRVSTLDGTITPDAAECAIAGISVARVEFTITLLGLNCFRLKVNRLAVVQQLEEDLRILDTQNPDVPANVRTVAQDYLGNGQTMWPAFFTTYRSFLGASAEDLLAQIGYRG